MIYYIILPIFCLKEITPKICVNCKFFKNSFTSDNRLRDNKYGKCSFFSTVEKHTNINFLVTGIQEINYFYCSTAREYNDMCGKEGKMYVKKTENENYQQ